MPGSRHSESDYVITGAGVAGQELVVESSMVRATRPGLDLPGVAWDTDGDSNKKSYIKPTNGAAKVLSSHAQ